MLWLNVHGTRHLRLSFGARNDGRNGYWIALLVVNPLFVAGASLISNATFLMPHIPGHPSPDSSITPFDRLLLAFASQTLPSRLILKGSALLLVMR
jgi:hypothetical protein